MADTFRRRTRDEDLDGISRKRNHKNLRRSRRNTKDMLRNIDMLITNYEIII